MSKLRSAIEAELDRLTRPFGKTAWWEFRLRVWLDGVRVAREVSYDYLQDILELDAERTVWLYVEGDWQPFIEVFDTFAALKAAHPGEWKYREGNVEGARGWWYTSGEHAYETDLLG